MILNDITFADSIGLYVMGFICSIIFWDNFQSSQNIMFKKNTEIPNFVL